MVYRVTWLSCLLILILVFLLPAGVNAAPYKSANPQKVLVDFPAVDPNYIYDQLFYMATHFQRREAGYDNNLPLNVNGHDEFAAYWMQEMLRNLDGFGAQVRRDEFPISGWQGRPASVPAFNVEVTVPGASHPEQEVVIGCHYDGEASSTQSANDDASGCAIGLGVARAMGAYWHRHLLYPARTLRLVIFDAEEQGLFGSFHYLNNMINGDVKNVVAMFNEEQNGIAYPLRYLGQLSNPLLPFYIYMSPLQDNNQYQHQNQLSQQQKENISHFRALMQQAVVASFEQFRASGFQMLSYHINRHQDIFQPIFTPEQISSIQQKDDTIGASDEVPFTLAGLPCATFSGNFSYYNANPPLWSYPFDQPEDTIQLMNTYADGSSQKSEALLMALGLPGMLTSWMLHQPDILGQVSAGGEIVGSTPIATISDIGQAVVGQSITLDAAASFDPAGNALTYTWDFGDGARASGISVSHIYTKAGTYMLKLTVSSTKAKRNIVKVINVGTLPTSYGNPYAQHQQDGFPQSNPSVKYPRPDDSLSDKVTTATVATTTTLPSASGTTSSSIAWILCILILILLLIVGGVLASMHRRKSRG